MRWIIWILDSDIQYLSTQPIYIQILRQQCCLFQNQTGRTGKWWYLSFSAAPVRPLGRLWDMLYHSCCSHHLDGDVQCNQAIADSLWKAIQIIVSDRIIHRLGKLSDFVLFVTCSLSDACDLLHIHVLKHQTSVIRVLNKGLVCRHISSMESRHI